MSNFIPLGLWQLKMSKLFGGVRRSFNIQYALDKWNPHETEENGSTYRMFHLTDFRENGSIKNNKKGKVRKTKE